MTARRSCNPLNPKALDVNYRCNEVTGRWVKATTVLPPPPSTTTSSSQQLMIRQLYTGMQTVLSSLSSEELSKALRKLNLIQRLILALRSGIENARGMTDDEILQKLQIRYTSPPVVVNVPVHPSPSPPPPVVTNVPVQPSPPPPSRQQDSEKVRVHERNEIPNFRSMSLNEVRRYANYHKIPNRSKMAYLQLIRALITHYQNSVLTDNQHTQFELYSIGTLRRYARIGNLPNSSNLPRRDLIRLLQERYPYVRDLPDLDKNRNSIETRLPSLSSSARTQQQIEVQQLPTQQQWWNRVCHNNDGTLQSQEWNDVSKDNVIRFQGFCFTLPEVYSMIHRAFTSTDTSYLIAPLRLQIPCEPFGRVPFTLAFFLQLRKKMKESNVPQYPEVLYFLRHVRKFYDSDNPIHRFITIRDPNKVQVSHAIEKFLQDGIRMIRKGERSNTEISWEFILPSNADMTDSQKLNYARGKRV